MLNKSYTYEISGGCGKTKIDVLFSDPTNNNKIDNDIIQSIINKKQKYIYDVSIKYYSYWMGGDKIETQIFGKYFEDTNNHGFVVFESVNRDIENNLYMWCECFIFDNHKTFETLGVSDRIVMAGSGTSSDDETKQSIMFVDTQSTPKICEGIYENINIFSRRCTINK